MSPSLRSFSSSAVDTQTPAGTPWQNAQAMNASPSCCQQAWTALRAMPLRMGYVAKSRYPCGEQFVRGTCRNQPSIVTCIA